MLLFVSILATVIAVLVVFTFREKPGAPIWKQKASEATD
jgi:hypothetical protein